MRRTHMHHGSKSLTLSLLALIAALMVCTAAAAQDDEENDNEFNPDPPVVDGETLGRGTVDEDLDLYWGGKRDLQVVEGQMHAKAGRLEFALFGGMIPNDPFVTHIPFGARAAYYFVDTVGVEVGGSWAGVLLDSELKTFLQDNRDIDENSDLRDLQQWRANAVLTWSPLYGKVALLQRKLSHFDLYLAGGFGVVGTQIPNADRTDVESAIKPEGIIGLGARFFVNEWFSLRLDYRQGFFPAGGNAEDDAGGVVLPSEITLGFAFMTGG